MDADTAVLPSFQVLRELAAQPIAKACIGLRTQQVVTAGWDIKPAATGSAERARSARRWFAHPDSLRPFAAWLATAVREVLETDSLAIVVQRTIGGGVGGWLGSGVAALAILDGATVKPAVDSHGELQGFVQPWPPEAAARPVTAAAGNGAPGSCFYAAPDALYLPRNPRPGCPYGRSPVERAIVRREGGEIDLTATDAAMPGVFGIGFSEDGAATDQAPRFAKDLRAWLKESVFDHVLHELCKAPDLEWAWTP